MSYYDQTFARLVEGGTSVAVAVTQVAEAYLDGKPPSRGKQKITRRKRDSEFWMCRAVDACSPEIWRSDEMVLALARYLSQEPVAIAGLVDRVASEAPDALIRAVRYSGLVLDQRSSRRAELSESAATSSEISELCAMLEIFERAHRDRVEYVASCKGPLVALSPFELLIYASLHAFETWVPRDLAGTEVPVDEDADTHTAWDAVNDLLIWKLSTAPESSLRLAESEMGMSLKAHLSPFIFPSALGAPPRHDLRAAFQELLAAQIELNSFLSRSTDAFSYDDGIRFEMDGHALKIVQENPALRDAWARDNDKLARLHGYWFYRALEEFARSDLASKAIGAPENHEANRLAYIRALRTHLRLTEVYGAGDKVTAETGEQVDLFQALLSLELMSAFFAGHFLAPFAEHLKDTGSVLHALSRLAMEGLQDDLQSRFPLTWSDRSTKVQKIKGWTVSAEHPGGSAPMAAAVLDFWTSDWAAMATRLRRGEPGLAPELFERPILKMGQTLLQLPWIVAVQNNSTAAINNLRRLGARRNEAASETRRVEQSLGGLFEYREYTVLANWHPPVGDFGDAGEIDLICARDGTVLVLEVKSTYLRRSQRDAFVHATTTLRKAGLQLRRKVQAVQRALLAAPEFAAKLGVDLSHTTPPVQGWIVDTSIESDHQRFHGFLKVSIEEVLIALRDERHLLNDPEGVLSGKWVDADGSSASSTARRESLYPAGFSAARFREVIENEMVWGKMAQANR